MHPLQGQRRFDTGRCPHLPLHHSSRGSKAGLSTVRHGSAQRSAPEHPRPSRRRNGTGLPTTPNRGRPNAPNRGRQHECHPVQRRGSIRDALVAQWESTCPFRKRLEVRILSGAPPAHLRCCGHPGRAPAVTRLPRTGGDAVIQIPPGWRRSLRHGSPQRRRRVRFEQHPTPATAQLSTVR
jgi:hypothetical protein